MEIFNFSKKQLLIIGILSLFLMPIFPIVIGSFIAFKLYKKQKIKSVILTILASIILAGITSSIYSDHFNTDTKTSVEQTNTNPQPSQSNKPAQVKVKEELKIKSTTVRSGSGIHGIIFSTDLDYYSSELENMQDISASVSGEVIPVDGRDKIELVLEYEPLELKSAGIFGGGSEFYIVEEDGSKARPSDAGGQRSFKIENDKAGVTFAPFVHINDDFKGGKAKLVLVLETKKGDMFTKEWVLDISPYVITQ